MIGLGATKIHYRSALLDVASLRIREDALAGVESYAATMEGVRDAVQLEAERCIRVWGSGGRAAEVLLQCRLREINAANSAGEIRETEAADVSRKIRPGFAKLA